MLQTYYARVDGALESFGGGLVDSPMSLVFDLWTWATPPTRPPPSSTTAPSRPHPRAAPSPRSTASHSPAPSAHSPSRRPARPGSSAPCPAAQPPRVSSGIARHRRRLSSYLPPEWLHSSPAASQSPENLSPSAIAPAPAPSRASRIPPASPPKPRADVPGTARWLGKVLRPPARSSADCEAAAQAVLALASSRSAALAGSYTAINPADDIWPGDVLDITANGQTLNVVVRTVHLDRRPRRPGTCHLSRCLCQRLGREPRPHALRSHRARRLPAANRSLRARAVPRQPAATHRHLAHHNRAPDRRRHRPARWRRLRSPPPRLGLRPRTRRGPRPALARPQLLHPALARSRTLLHPRSTTPQSAALLAAFERCLHQPSRRLTDCN